MAFRRLVLTFICVVAVAMALSIRYSPPVVAGEGFQPPSPEELSMKSEPLAPGAPAIVLYRQVDRDDTGLTAHEYNYVRIKILTEEGRKHADVEIPFFKEDGMNVANLKARTIEPDGTIINFEGKAFEKSIAKARGLKYMAKTFTFPNVQVGSVLEYYYTLDLPERYVFDSHWILSQDLFTKHAKFSLKPYTSSYIQVGVRWTWQGLPPGSGEPRQANDHLVRLEVNNVPAFRTEDYMPPENELKARVDFTYTDEDFETDPAKFWKKKGKKLNDRVESFVGKRKAMEEAVAQIVSPSDTPEVKVRKIYDKVQSIRNTSYEVQRSEQERKRDKEKPVSNVEELWKKGYGNGVQLTWLFLALVRAAGIEAYPVMASDRRNYFFHPNTMDAQKLNSNVVLVKLGEKELYFDPGAAFTPFGLLEWSETGVRALRLDKDGGTWVQTMTPEASASRVERRADFTLSTSGDLEGKVTITFIGLEAMQRRVEQRNEDETARKKFLEEQAKEYIPAASEVDLVNKPDWTSSSAPLIAEYNIKIPGWAAGAGRRALFPMGVFSATEKRVFDHTERVHPIYFEFPFERIDDITVTLPQGWQISSVPQEANLANNVLGYWAKAEKAKDSMHLTRKLHIGLILLDSKNYPALRDFFHSVRQGDEQQIVLLPSATNAAN
ncbi:MAG TPA: DUF3857 domain-containing protein [Terriglobales bacterium]|nr:DUF3857 domain-containing protein [Terriglobales bacterium]